MAGTEDKEWAKKYLLDPLTAPQPSEETGPGSHFSSITKNTKGPSVATYPTPPTSASPTRSTFHQTNPYSPSYRQQAFGKYGEDDPSRSSVNGKSAAPPHAPGRQRGSSLGERFPGDMSHRPLDLLKKEAKAANRSPHLQRKHIPGADLIDSLDRSVLGPTYHHGGPYDATLLARNTSIDSSPVAAVKESNSEALKATPAEHIRDALDKHVPLQGTAVIPPGMYEISGRQMKYEEGEDLMRDADAPGGAYRRWPGIKYHPDDLKGKGDPSFTIEKALKDHQSNVHSHRRILSDSNSSYEMQTRPQSGTSRPWSAGGNGTEDNGNLVVSTQNGVARSNTTGRRVSEGLKRRFGSLRKSKKNTDEVRGP